MSDSEYIVHYGAFEEWDGLFAKGACERCRSEELFRRSTIHILSECDDDPDQGEPIELCEMHFGIHVTMMPPYKWFEIVTRDGSSDLKNILNMVAVRKKEESDEEA